MAKICRNYKIFLLEVPIVKIKRTVKNYHEQVLHQLELKFLSAILTNLEGNFQSTICRAFSTSLSNKQIWLSGLRHPADGQMIDGSSPRDA